MDHGQLSGKADDDHPQYLKLTKAGQTITEDLAVTAGKKVDGRVVSVDGVKLDTLPTGPIGSLLGSWAVKAIDTSHLAATDGFVVATIYGTDVLGYITGLSDAANPPTTVRCYASAGYVVAGSNMYRNSFTLPVKKGDYYKVTLTNVIGSCDTIINWIPLGS